MKRKLKKLFDYLYRRPELVFVLIALPFGIFSAVFVPQISVTDEDSHLLRIYQVARGEFVCHKSTTYPQEIVDKSKSGSGGSRDYTMDFSDEVDGMDQKHSCGSAAGYAPVAYLPQATGVILSQTLHPTAASAVLFARLMSLFFYIGAVYWIIKKVRVGKYVFFIVALIPQMIHLAASLSADMMNNVVTLAIVALTLTLFTQKQKIGRRQILLLVLLVALAAVLKQSLILVLLPLVFLPVRIFKPNEGKLAKWRININKWLLGGALAVVFCAVYIAWTKFSNVYTPPSPEVFNPIADQPRYFLNLLFNTYLSDYGDLVLRGVIGEFSSFMYHFPTILVFAQIILLLIVYLRPDTEKSALRAGSKGIVIGATAAFIVSILVITYGLYTAWGLKRGISQYADGVQGRYFTALLVLLIPLFSWLRQYVTLNFRSDKLLFAVVVIGQIGILGFYVLYTLKTLYTT